ncbi:MAG: bifunctional phosphoribosylaminoimidazolecarboxamide formyltransferase/IMP cyclohydrolase [Firmicutes bacterium]|nr:bifunctional phosphoribosylaminoimidazolecarboxamide formyltransferase/IMP cyclohydrolase [Bacillota bacterium]
MKKYALISVSDKTNLIELAQGLILAGYTIISTGGTAKALTDSNVANISVEDITEFPECMDGRLKTLHPRISGGLLGVRDNAEHATTMQKHKIPNIDILVVNLYPFKATISKQNHTLENAIENIDIGGPTMIRAAAKNYKYVAVVTDSSDYDELVKRAAAATIDNDYRYKLAAKAFAYTAAYDSHIANYLARLTNDNGFSPTLTLTFDLLDSMRYGENPHQKAAYYSSEIPGVVGIEQAKILNGKALSYNNIADTHAAMALASEFSSPVCVAVKHSTPCGVALGADAFSAFSAAYECDPMSIFGGIIAFNCEVDKNTAKKMHEIFLEVIIAPSFSEDALAILRKKKNLRLLVLSNFANSPMELKSVGAGLLIQESDTSDIEKEPFNLVAGVDVSEQVKADLIFAMKVVKHVKSNAIVVAKDGKLLGQGGGEVSRIWAAQAAISRAGEKANGAVLASDAMFPFPDVVESCATAKIAAIIQPGGSQNDQASIDACNNHGISMFFTGVRHFKH